MRNTAASIGLLIVMSCFVSPVASAPMVLPNGVPTIDLPTPNRSSVPHAVAYNPEFDQYYGADSGSTNRRAWVWNDTGAVVQNFPPPIGVDFRGLNYNPNTNALEVVTFGAVTGDGGGVQGLMTMGLTGAGLYDGTSVNTLVSLPGLAGSQTVPSYNPMADVLYSRSNSGTVNVVRRSNGTLQSVINLDLAAAGSPSLQDGIAGYDQAADALIVLEPATSKALVFDLAGGFLGDSQLSGVSLNNSNGNVGYTNGQLFVFDDTQEVYHGFRIFVPEPSTFGLAALSLLGLGSRRRSRAGNSHDTLVSTK